MKKKNNVIFVFLCGQIDRQTNKFKKKPKTLLGPTGMLCVNCSSVRSLVLEQVEKTSVLCLNFSKLKKRLLCVFLRTKADNQIINRQILKKKITKILSGPTRVLSVNFSSIVSVVLESIPDTEHKHRRIATRIIPYS